MAAFLPRGEQIAWALKGLKVSGAPSPPRTDRQGAPVRRKRKRRGEGEEEAGEALMAVREVGFRGVCGGDGVNYGV